jgi:hypothetical protein
MGVSGVESAVVLLVNLENLVLNEYEVATGLIDLLLPQYPRLNQPGLQRWLEK